MPKRSSVFYKINQFRFGYKYVTSLRPLSQALFLLELYKARVFFKNKNSRLADIQMRYQADLRGQSTERILLGNLFFGHSVFIFHINAIKASRHDLFSSPSCTLCTLHFYVLAFFYITFNRFVHNIVF